MDNKVAYTVKSGDNLSKIARQYGMDVRDLIASNPQIANPNLIRPGQSINIPEEPASPAARAAAGNVLAAAPSVAQVVRTAAQTAPTVVAQRVAPAISPTGLAIYQASERGISAGPTAARAVAPLPQGQGRTLLPTARTTPTVPLGQAFPRAGAALTPRGTVAAGQAALMTPRAAQVGTRQPAPAGSRGMGPGPQPQVIGARQGAPLIPAPTAPLGQAFPRTAASLTPRGIVAAGAAALRTPTAAVRPGPSPEGLAIYQASERGLVTQPVVPKAVTQHLDYLDQLRAIDPDRAAEAARFQSATIGRAQPEAALATNVFFTETAINQGQLPRNASENVWDQIAARMGTGMTGAQLLRQQGYVPIGGGLWYLGRLGGGGGVSLGAGSTRNLRGGSAGGAGGGDGGDGGRFLNW